MAPDPLAQFILQGEDREVDAWWAKDGMGYRRISDKGPSMGLVGKLGLRYHKIPHYTTDGAQRIVIEDRMADLDIGPDYAWALYIAAEDLDHQTYGATYWAAMRLDNRQVILAAARAMGLEGPEFRTIKRTKLKGTRTRRQIQDAIENIRGKSCSE